MKNYKTGTLSALALGILPLTVSAQGPEAYVGGLQAVLDELYGQMIPLCSGLIGISRGIAGFAAIWYIAARVWKHISNAEPVDLYPLFRPFAIGFCIMVFPTVLSMINGIMKPAVSASALLVKDSNRAVTELLKMKEEALMKTDGWHMYVGIDGQGDRERWYRYTHTGQSQGEGVLDRIGNDIKFAMAKASYSFRNSVKEWMSEILELLFESSALCINTLRTFQLIVLSILGPLVFGLSVFDGFQHTLTVWIARYINVFLWLPVANIFGAIIGKIQENMLKLDLSQIGQTGDTFFSRTDAGYLIFLIIGIAGYFTVPSVANYIVHAGGGSALTQKVTRLFSSSARGAVGSGAAGFGMAADAVGHTFGNSGGGMASSGQSEGYFRNEGRGSRP
ncbi:conjugative transposon protein TraJ [Marinilongibacter aquaticus]|uniref:conjugative transposon protein TraJ n=1 Tax=Marinilongibacter aquaticus TaxID=2975157 RepID=UPI0021BDA47E|nr:conjugative transposon protein TraJ [Marinilongibacter aquaticus]UBM58717.1 conjugative transposon protein TraJ [Marinilongibacter aquaticus]